MTVKLHHYLAGNATGKNQETKRPITQFSLHNHKGCAGRLGMDAENKTSARKSGWSSTEAYVMAVICLLVGTAAGYLLRGSAPAGASAGPAAQPEAATPSMPDT